MKTLQKALAAALVAGGTLALTASAASAEIVCNEDNVCWHVHRHYVYRPEFRLVVHPDNWRWRAHEHYVWREHHGRGYWRGGVWVQF